MSAADDFATARGVGDGDSPPIDDYGELTVARILPLLERLTRIELLQVREYERRHANRVGVLGAIERALG